MTLLIHGEYISITANLDLFTAACIDESYRPALSVQTCANLKPATGEELPQIAPCGAADVDFAVDKAREAFDDGR